MANKKHSKKHTGKRARPAPQTGNADVAAVVKLKAEAQSPAVIGERLAFVVGILGVLLLVTLFMPWTTNGGIIQRGIDLVLNYGSFPAAIRDNFDAVGGRTFGITLCLITAAALTSGFGWRRLWTKWGDRLAGVQMTLALVASGAGLMLLLALLNMSVRKNVETIAILAAVLLLMLAAVPVWQLATLDRAAGRTEGALRPSDWAVLLGGLSAVSLIHYALICYKLVLPAPEALISKLRTLR